MSTLNTLVPMEDPAGNRCFVNNWDVKARQDDGWKILGKLEHHNASIKAPVDLLVEPPAPPAKTPKDPKPPKDPKDPVAPPAS